MQYSNLDIVVMALSFLVVGLFLYRYLFKITNSTYINVCNYSFLIVGVIALIDDIINAFRGIGHGATVVAAIIWIYIGIDNIRKYR